MLGRVAGSHRVDGRARPQLDGSGQARRGGGPHHRPRCVASVRAHWHPSPLSPPLAPQVYEYFVSATNGMAVALDKSPVRWEEVWTHFRTALAPSTIIQAWLSSAALADAANNGYRAIFSVSECTLRLCVAWRRLPASSGIEPLCCLPSAPSRRALPCADAVYYLDYTGTTWDVMYDTDPLAGVPNASAHQFVLGGEAAMWGESVDASNVLGEEGEWKQSLRHCTTPHLDVPHRFPLATIWPRAAAVAERLWTYDPASSAQDYDVVTRLAAFRCLLLERGVPAPLTGNQQAGSPPPSWTVGSCEGGYRQLC